MADPYPNQSANTIYGHLRSLSNTIGDLGDIVTSLHFSAVSHESTDTNMPSFSPPGSIRRRFLRIISFGRYSSRSADDTEPLTNAHGPNRRHSAPANMDIPSNDRPTYTAHQSPQSSDSCQTTIVHDVPPGTVPFSIDAFRGQHHHMSDTEFDTPSKPEEESETIDTAVRGDEPSWDPTRLRRNKSIMHCNICNRIWEYNQIHCPGCAARTLHHISGSSEDSYTDSEVSGHDPRPLHHRPGRRNPERGVSPTESSWATHELESGTAEESWVTTTANVSATETAQASSEQSTETHPAGKDLGKKHRPTHYAAAHCCCRNVNTHKDSNPNACIQPCTLRIWPIPAAGQTVCRCSRCGSRHVRRYVEILEDHAQSCERSDGGHEVTVKKKGSWLMRLLRWSCCC